MNLATQNSIKLRFNLIWAIAKTDYVQRYYGSSLGLLWALINPIFRLLVYYVVFAYLIFRNRDPEFILYLFLGITAWTYFSENTNKGLGILKQKKYLIQNIEINKLDLFFSSAISTSFSFFLNVLIYLLFTLFFEVPYTINILGVLLLFLNLFILVIGVSMILATAFLYLNDLKHLWDMVILLGFWTVPIIWDYHIALEEYKILLYASPITGIVINLRYVLLYGESMDWLIFLYDFGYATVLFILGLFSLKHFSHKAVEVQ